MSRINKLKVFVAMSGGVDSSVTALLLKKKGYDVTGVFMRCYNLDGCSERDAEDARRVAAYLGIPFYVWDFEDDYKKRVVEYMICGYKQGITPNPDVMCNKEIKFGLFLEKALSLGANYIATGHYIRLRRKFSNFNCQFTNEKGKDFENFNIENSLKIVNCKLKIAKDLNKDQSYFLWTLTQEQLRYCLFPIGDYLKSEVREIARCAGLPTAEKKDSQGICFLGKISLTDFLRQYIPEKRGAVLTTAGEKVGEHSGVWYHTIGQRHLRIKNYESRIKGRHKTPPLYVASKDVKTNILIVAEGENNPTLYKKEIDLSDVSFIQSEFISLIRANKGYKGIEVLTRVRYRQPLSPAKLYKLQAESYKLVFNKPVKFIAPGQSAVFYSKNGELLGGGIIV